MAVKVSDLTTESAPASTDLLLIADPSTGLAKKITVAALKTYMDGLGGGGDVTAPTVVSITATAGSTIVVVFSESVTVTTAGWSFKQNGGAWAASSVSGSGATWTFTMATSAISSDTLLYSYSAASGATVDTSSNELANITDQSITNSIGGVAPTITSKTVETGAPDDIVVVFSQSMSAVTTAGWSAKKNGSPWTISSVSGSGNTWTFDMASDATTGDVLLISYDASTGATIGSSIELGSFTDSSVTNNVVVYEAIDWVDATANFVEDTLGGFHFTSFSSTIGARASKKLTGGWSLLVKLKADDADSGLVWLFLSSVNDTNYSHNDSGQTGIVGGFTTYLGDMARNTGPTTENTYNTTIGTGIVTDGMWILIERVSDDLLYHTSPDGVTFTLRSTDTNAVAGVTDVFIKAMNGAAGVTDAGFAEVKGLGLATI